MVVVMLFEARTSRQDFEGALHMATDVADAELVRREESAAHRDKLNKTLEGLGGLGGVNGALRLVDLQEEGDGRLLLDDVVPGGRRVQGSNVLGGVVERAADEIEREAGVGKVQARTAELGVIRVRPMNLVRWSNEILNILSKRVAERQRDLAGRRVRDGAAHGRDRHVHIGDQTGHDLQADDAVLRGRVEEARHVVDNVLCDSPSFQPNLVTRTAGWTAPGRRSP